MTNTMESGLNMQERHLVDLVKKFQGGDVGAYDKIYSLSYPGVYYSVYKMVRDTYEAQDITQEIFMSVFQSLNTLREPVTFRKWLSRTAWCHTLDYLKSRKCTSTAGADIDAMAETDFREVSDAGAEDVILAAERRNAVMKAVDALPPNMRITVLLKYFNDYKEKEIAEILDIPVGTVKSRLVNAKSILSGKLTGVYSVFPFFFVRLAAFQQFHTVALDKKGALLGGVLKGKKGAVVLGIAAGTTAAVVLQGPSIRNVKYYGQDTYVNHQNVEWTVKSPLPVKEAVVEGKSWKVTAQGDHYTVTIPENGSFVLSVTDAAGQTARCTVDIGNIDNEAPVYRNYTESGESIILSFSDALSGVNWDRITFRKEDGTEVKAEAVDPEKGQVRLAAAKFPMKARVEDLAGNYGDFSLTLNVIERPESGEERDNADE